MPAVVEPSAPVLFWMVPPVPAPPVPVTVRLPTLPRVQSPPQVLSNEIPTPLLPAPVPAEILSKVSPAVPIVVPFTLSAAPLVVVIVLFDAAGSATVTVPPPVA